MPERTVKVNLVAEVSGYIAGMDRSARSTRLLATEAERLAAKRQVFDQLGRGLVVFGAIAAAAVGIAVKKFAEFDQAMSQVNAVTQETTENMALLRDAALDAGGRTVFTATEAANAIEELGKAGLSTADILSGALDGALSLAASGQLEVARAAEITATTLKQFGLDGTQAGHVADVLSAGAGKALGSVEDLAQGLKFVGPVAASMGVSLEETTGALALFADQGIIGEQAGTSLRGVLSSLTSPSAQAAKEIENLKINLYDANGGFIGLEGLAGKLGDAYQKLDDKTRDASLGIIFGNQQVTAARVLFQGGAEDIAKYTAEVNDTGYAARVARDRMDNLAGDVEKLGGAFDTALIKGGSGANDTLRELIQTVTFLVDGIGNAPQPVLDVGLALGVVTAATALAGGAALIAVPKWAAFKAIMIESGISGGRAAIGIGLAGGAIAVATGYIAFFATTAANAARTQSEIRDTLDESTGAITEYTRAWITKSVAENEWITKSAKDVGVSQRQIVDALINGGDELEALKSKFAGQNNIVDFFNGSGVAAGNASQSIRELSAGLEGAEEDFRKTPPVALSAADAYQKAADNAAALQSNLDELIASINEANGVGQDAVSSNAAYQQTLADVADTIKQAQEGVDGYSTSVDESTAAGSKNADMFADLAKKSQDAAKAQLDLDGNVDGYLSTLEGGRQTLYDQILALTGSADAAQELTDKIYAIPSEKEVKVLVDKTNAQSTLDEFFTLNNGRVIYAHVEGSLKGGFASGGYTGDMPATAVAGVVHGREFVINDAATSKPANRAAAEFMNAGGDITNYGTSPTYQPAPAAAPYAVSSGASSRSTKVELNAHGVDPQTVTDMLLQRIGTGLVRL
jgi:TP901 family phage tail tape measure protein